VSEHGYRLSTGTEYDLLLDSLRRLLAHVLSTDTGARIRRALAATVPDHLVPSVVYSHQRFPLNANGKFDVAAVRPVMGPAPEPVTPRTPLELVVSDIANDVLGVRPGTHDNLFELGMHSLQAMRLATRTATATGRVVGLDLVFANPTVAGLAAALTSVAVTAGRIVRVPR
jgi:aryl carrier-like protein